MTALQLIAELQKMPPDLPVSVTGAYGASVDDISVKVTSNDDERRYYGNGTDTVLLMTDLMTG